jgi:hypothetical protein
LMWVCVGVWIVDGGADLLLLLVFLEGVAVQVCCAHGSAADICCHTHLAYMP